VSSEEVSTEMPEMAAGLYRSNWVRSDVPVDGVPTDREIDDARRLLHAAGVTSPTVYAPRLSSLLGREVWVKCEFVTSIQSFKLRGATVAVEHARQEGYREICTVSTGNHGQGVALAAQRAGITATVALPANSDPFKQGRIRALGAEVVVVDGSLTDTEEWAQEYCRTTGAHYLEDGDNRWLMAGAATIGREIVEQVPGCDLVVTPVGGGNLAAGICLGVASGDAPPEIVGVQSTAAPGVTKSWLDDAVVSLANTTVAGGLATEKPGALALGVLRSGLSTCCLVDDDELVAGVGTMYQQLGYVLETAGVAAAVALEKHSQELAGDCVVLVASGGCIAPGELITALTAAGQSTAG
jgi:threonine dehydratase